MGSTDHDEVMSSGELVRAFSLLWNCSLSYIKAMSLKCAIELGIPDIIHKHGQPAITFSKLVEKLPIDPSKTHCIYRIMRLLVHLGFFATQKTDDTEQEGQEKEAYSLTNVSRLLLTGAPAFMKLKTFYLNPLLPQSMGQWHSLSNWLKNSDLSLCETAYGTTLWDQLAHDPELSNIFNEAMAGPSELFSKVILNAEYKSVFEGLKSLVDVGGGSGSMAKAIANAFPHMKCTVFDLPHVVSNFQGTDNLSFIGGNVFSDAIPPADAILLKSILHNWNDEDSIKILKRCREAILSNAEGGKIIAIENMTGDIEETKDLTELKFSNDVAMMTLSGKVRSVTELEKLIWAAKFSRYKMTPILGSVLSIVEVFP